MRPLSVQRASACFPVGHIAMHHPAPTTLCRHGHILPPAWLVLSPMGWMFSLQPTHQSTQLLLVHRHLPARSRSQRRRLSKHPKPRSSPPQQRLRQPREANGGGRHLINLQHRHLPVKPSLPTQKENGFDPRRRPRPKRVRKNRTWVAVRVPRGDQASLKPWTRTPQAARRCRAK